MIDPRHLVLPVLAGALLWAGLVAAAWAVFGAVAG